MYQTFFTRDSKNNLKCILSSEDLAEWIAKAKTLSRTDWTIEKRQFEKPVPPDHECSVEGEEKKVYWDCKICSQRHWENPNENKN